MKFLINDSVFINRYLASDDAVDSMAVIGPENTEFEQDESWEKKTGL